MGPQTAARPWTLVGLILAFVDLALAYFLLCVSAAGFLCSKFLNVFGFFIPCPCRGVLGFVDSRLCLHKLLVEIPLRNILAVQVLIKSRLPFSLIYYEDQGGCFNLKVDRNGGSENCFLVLGSEDGPVSGSALVVRSVGDRGAGDVKGKGVVGQKQQKSARRRKKVAFSNGKCSSSLRNLGSPCSAEMSSVRGGNEVIRSEIGESLSPLSIEEVLQGDESGPFGTDVGETSGQGFELGESFEVGDSAYIDSSCADSFIHGTIPETVADEVNRTRLLEKALQEVRTAYNALSSELEKERAAAATAAEEAMAMISRLQNVKASLEMEVRQNQRMVDEKFAYDEEEMNILKEILVRREMENFVLEKEVEAFKQMISSSDVNSEECPQEEDIQVVNPQVENDGTDGERSYRFSQGAMFQNKSLQLELKTEPSNSVENLMNVETISEIQECSSCDREESKKYGQEGDDEEPQVIYDVHVVDVKTEQPVKGSGKEGPVVDDSSDIELMGRQGSLNMNVGLEGFSSIRDPGRSSLSTVSSERLRLDEEVEWLREMLRKVQDEKEKLKLSSENRDKGRIQLKLLEEIRDQLQEIQKLREPLRQTSLPPAFHEKNVKRRRSQSATWNVDEWKTF